MTLLHFSPYQALFGGAILGAATLARLFAFGTVTGISGMFKKVMAASTDFYQRAESFCFVGGLICSGAVLMGSSYHTIIPPSGVSLGRTVIAALLVEFGARVQNGCTSGHGICGLSRLSVRSLAAVGMFMTSGFAFSTLMNTASDFGVDRVNLSPLPFDTNSTFENRVAAASLLSLAVCTLAARLKLLSGVLPYVFEVVSGFSFGCGLFISGMVNPAKVASFLTVSTTLFDPTLMFVMAGGIAVSLPGFQYIMHQQAVEPSILSFLGRKFEIPSNRTIDLRLAAGALMFGAGWGLLGICPGPALVSVATLQPRIVVFCLTYASSFLFFEYVFPMLPTKLHAA